MDRPRPETRPLSLAGSRFHPLRTLPLDRIEAVGFDLDHTLAAYDDHALNQIAAEETVGRLVTDYGYPQARVAGFIAEHTTAVRTVGLDLVHGLAVKVAHERTVGAARGPEGWLSRAELERRFPGRSADGALWQLHSPFDLPVLWFYEALAPAHDGDLTRLSTDIRRALDATHTRGELKTRIARDLTRFVSPAGRVRETILHLAASGRTLFVVTNSHRDYAARVLDIAVGTDWPRLFALVVVDARKPSFFDSARDDVLASARDSVAGAVVIDGSNAHGVEEALGVRGDRVLYLGDNLRADVAAARAFGWRAGVVVPEYGSEVESAWGGLFRHGNAPTWFAHEVAARADLLCDRVDHLLGMDWNAGLEPNPAFLAALTADDPA